MRRILVTGAGQLPGSALAVRLGAEPDVERVVGVDTFTPGDELPGVSFVRADVRTSLVGSLIEAERIDTVVHLDALSGPPGPGGGREVAVIGTLQLLAAAQRANSLQAIVVQSSTAVYGAGPNDPALATEESPLPGATSGRARDATETEKYAAKLAEQRPEVRVCVLRFAPLAGPRVRTPFARYLRRPIMPTVLGFDPRIQLLHEDDAVAALLVAVLGGAVGTFNVAGDGVLYLSQAARRLGRRSLPVPTPALPWLIGRLDLPIGQLRYGRVVDTARMKKELGFRPAHTTASALETLREAGDG